MTPYSSVNVIYTVFPGGEYSTVFAGENNTINILYIMNIGWAGDAGMGIL